MQNLIKDIIYTKVTEKSWQGVGVDEEQQLISFSPEDLNSVIKAVLHVAADLCVFNEDNMRIKKYAEEI
jgi:hypothetical protein